VAKFRIKVGKKLN